MALKYEHHLLLLSFVIATIFTVSLTENLQIADGFSASATKITLETKVGNTDIFKRAVINDETETINLEFYATGPGSELLVFEEFVSIEPRVRQEIEIIVVIPDDHPDNVE